MWRSTKENETLDAFCIFQLNSHDPICVSLGNIKFCYR
jgi:hypothetical protein